jgi:hypothetical protein
MSLEAIFNSIVDSFEQQRLEFALIGGFALYGYGYVRATRDIDFITRLTNQKKMITFLESLGFETTHCSDAFSNHVHLVSSDQVDIMYVDGITADEIFSAVEKRAIFKGTLVPVVAPQHLIAMKLFAASSNPERKLRDLSDVKAIYTATNVDKEIVKKYIIKYHLEAYYHDIVGRE